MDIKDYEEKFFEIAEEKGHKIEICKRGQYTGEKQIDFGNKKLHAGHVRKLFSLAKDNEILSYEDFEKIVPGRPCAVPYFNNINREIHNPDLE